MVAELVRDLMPYRDSIVEGLERMASRQRELLGALAAESGDIGASGDSSNGPSSSGASGDSSNGPLDKELARLILGATQDQMYIIGITCAANNFELKVFSHYTIDCIKAIVANKFETYVDPKFMTLRKEGEDEELEDDCTLADYYVHHTMTSKLVLTIEQDGGAKTKKVALKSKPMVIHVKPLVIPADKMSLAGNKLVEIQKPVSYTHLTLPTKRIV